MDSGYGAVFSVGTLLLLSPLQGCVHTGQGRPAGSCVLPAWEGDSVPRKWENLGQGQISHTFWPWRL